MLKRQLRNATLAAALLAAAPAALADGSKGQAPGREFLKCASTPAVKFQGTIVDAALATPELQALADAVVAAGLAGTLSGAGPFAVYAPTNSAFAKIPPAVLSAITSDTQLLTAVLTYHVTPGRNADPRLVFTTPREVATCRAKPCSSTAARGRR